VAAETDGVTDRRKGEVTGSVGSIAFAATLVAVVVVLLAATAGMHPSASLVPRVVGFPLAGLLGYLLIRDLISRRSMHGAGAASSSGTHDEIQAILWLLALPAMATLVGFVAGPALYVSFWARFRAGERVVVAVLAGAATALAIVVLFGGVLGAHLPQGVFAEWLQ
jgi:hypothetical protein